MLQLFDTDVWQEIFDVLKRHKLRTALTAFGVFWGIFMLVVLMGAGNGLQNGAESNFTGAKNSVFIWSGRPTSIPYKGLSRGRYIRLNDTDMEALYSRIPEIQHIAPSNGMGDRPVNHADKTETYSLSGIQPIEITAQGYRLEQGRFLNELDIEQKRKVVVIGTHVRDVLFNGENPVGKTIKTLGVRFLVVGVIAPASLADWAQRDTRRVYFPNTTLRSTFNQRDVIHRMLIAPKDGVDAAWLEQQVQTVLKERHKIHPDDHGVIGSYNAQKDYTRVQSLFTGIRLFSWFVAVGTIIAGVVGVGNIMLISVKERTKEIGIRKALGATPRAIIATILQESIVLTFISGYFGLVAGVFVIELASKLMPPATTGSNFFSNPEIDFTTALTAISVLLIAGAIASVMPAQRAAGVNPVVALQDE